MDVSILGPLRLTVGGDEVAVPPGRQRALLSLLAVHVDRVVSVDQLLDVVWGQALPDDPANALQWRISQLRRLVGRDTIVRESTGYRLGVDAEVVDAHRFEQLARRGHDRLAAGDHDAAAATLTTALELWRGDPLADVADETWAQPEITRLTELRAAAAEDRFEASLRLGRDAAIVAELEAALDAQPLRERLRCLLMEALYRSGRQAAALEVYERGRRLLADELGLDPGPELQRLQRDILGQADHLVTARPGGDAEPRPNVPARLTSFVGRDEDLDRLQQLLEDARLVTLTGPGGAGKSRLAVEVADRVEPADGVRLVELAGITAGEDVAAAVLDVLESAGSVDLAAGRRSPVEHLLAALAPRQLLLVVDNCEHVVASVAALAGQMLVRCPGLTVLATSREALDVPGEVTWPVPPLPAPRPEDGVEAIAASPAATLLVDRLRSHRPGFTLDAGTAPAVATICRRLDGLPLALELAAARGRILAVDDIAAGLDDRFELLVGRNRSLLPRQRALRAVIDWSWELLDEEHRRAAAVLSVFVGPFSLADGSRLLSAVSPGFGGAAANLVTGLAERSLLEPQVGRTTRFRMLETIRAYARERLLDHHLAVDPHQAHAELMADAVGRLHPRHPDDGDVDLAALDGLLNDVRAALHEALARRDLATAQRLAGGLGWYWWLRGRRDEGRRWLDAALEETIHDERAALWAGFLRLGEHDREPAGPLATAARAADPTVAVPARVFEGAAIAGHGDLDRAGTHLRAVVAEAVPVGGWPLALARQLLATVEFARGHVESAGDALALAEDGFVAADAWWGRLLAADLRGHLDQLADDYDAAVAGREAGMELARRHGVPEYETVQSIHLGNLTSLLDQHERARDLHAHGRHLADRTGHRPLVAFAANASGIGARRRGDLEEAARFHRRAADLYDAVGNPDGAAFALGSLGFIAQQQGEPDRSLPLALDGLARAERTGDPRALAFGLESVAGALVAGDPERAARLLGAATRLRADLGVPLPAPERTDVDRIARALETRLGATASTLREEGAELALDQAVSLAAATVPDG